MPALRLPPLCSGVCRPARPLTPAAAGLPTQIIPPPAAPLAALPTLILFKQGRPVDRVEGVVMGPDLKNRLEYLLGQPQG